MGKTHRYTTRTEWTGNTGAGTKDYLSYLRHHIISAGGKDNIAGSSDPSFRGDPDRYNPEELLLASLSACHMLWFLHLCAENGIVVLSYEDNAIGKMEETTDGSGQFTEVILQPAVMVEKPSMIEKMTDLHQEAHQKCFIANSVNFPVRHQPVIRSMAH